MYSCNRSENPAGERAATHSGEEAGTRDSVRPKKRDISRSSWVSTNKRQAFGTNEPCRAPRNSYCQGTRGSSQNRCENDLRLRPARAYSVYSNSIEPSISKAGGLGLDCKSKLFTAGFWEWPPQESSVIARVMPREEVTAPTSVSNGTAHGAQLTCASLQRLRGQTCAFR